MKWLITFSDNETEIVEAWCFQNACLKASIIANNRACFEGFNLIVESVKKLTEGN